MYYSEKEARELVLKTSLELVEKQLVSRTWGNVSARISKDEFVITPSGKAYDKTTVDDLVIVKIADLSYTGDIKPSSEKGVHARAYMYRPECNFIIHTHQFYGCVIASEGRNIPEAPCARYGLPGSEKLMENITKSIISNPDKDAFLMEKHGVLVLGASELDALNLALRLEESCKKLYDERLKTYIIPKNRLRKRARKPWLDDYAMIVGNGKHISPDEDMEAVEFIMEKNEACARYVKYGKPMGYFDSTYQRYVYVKRYSKLKDK